MDASQGMLDELGKKASEGGWKNVKSACMMLESPAQLAPFGAPFNLILSAMTFHHIEDVSSILRLLYDCLKPGGVLCFVDLEFTHESPTKCTRRKFTIWSSITASRQLKSKDGWNPWDSRMCTLLVLSLSTSQLKLEASRISQ